MTYTNRRIILTLMIAIVAGYGALYAVTLQSVHKNGLSSEYFIIAGLAGDGYEYFSLANTMLTDGRFARTPTAEPEYFRTPAYPLFMASILALTKNIVFVPLVQIILAACSAALIFLLGARFFTRNIGLASAILFAIEPSVFTNAFVSATDTLFVLTLLLSVYVLCMSKELNYGRVFFVGVLLGVLALVRPIGLYLSPLVFLWLLWEGRHNWKQAFKTSVLFLIGTCLVVAPWMTRNYAYSGHATISSVAVYNFLFYNIITFEHERTGVSKEVIHTDILRQLDVPDSDSLTSLTLAAKEFAVARTYFLAHPFAYTAFHLYSTVPFYIGSSIEATTRAVYARGVLQGSVPPDINVSSLVLKKDFGGALVALTDNMPILIERLMWLILCIASLGTALVALRKKAEHASITLLFLVLSIALGVLTGPVSYARYRLPAEPFIFILGVAGIVSLLRYARGVLRVRRMI